MTVELLYLDGCPGYARLLPRLQALLQEAGAGDALVLREIDGEAGARAERFLGSPTVRVDGRDVEPGAADRDDFGFKCRLYRTPGGIQDVPPEDWIAEAIRRARGRA